MIEIDGKIISKEIFEKKFACDLSSCKGACCVEGDSGAPLLKSEIKELKKIHKKVKSYMSEKGLEVVEKKGVYVVDQEGDLTTPLVNERECAYVVFENGISKCAIEKAYIDKKINFKKFAIRKITSRMANTWTKGSGKSNTCMENSKTTTKWIFKL